MATVKDILTYIETLAPSYMKESWDNVGLLCGDPAAPVRKILVALDPFEGVCREAKEVGADLLVTHHPLIFQPTKAITTQTSIGRSILTLCAAGISAVNAHTNLDCAPRGVNEVLAKKLDLKCEYTLSQCEENKRLPKHRDIRHADVIDPKGVDSEGHSFGLLRSGFVDETDLDHFLQHVKQKLGTPVLRFVRSGKSVRKVAVGGGSCASAMHLAMEAGCDTFVTADVKYNQFWEAKELGLNLIDAGHFYTENPVVSYLAACLTLNFPEIEVKISETHRDCMEFY